MPVPYVDRVATSISVSSLSCLFSMQPLQYLHAGESGGASEKGCQATERSVGVPPCDACLVAAGQIYISLLSASC